MGKLILSVMIPAFDASDTLASSVKSALRDLPQNSEVLVYLDGPDPKASKVLELLKDNRIRVLESSVNRGEFYARNMLLEHAKGEFVANLDADDISLPKRFGRQIRLIESGEADFVFSNAIYLKNRAKVTTLRPNWPFPMSFSVSPAALALYDPFINSTMASRLTTLTRLGGFRKCTSPDYELWMRAAASGLRMVREKKYGVLFRVHDKQMTQSVDWQKESKADILLTDAKKLLWHQLGMLGPDAKLDVSTAENFLFARSNFAKIELQGIVKFAKQLSLLKRNE